MGLDMYLNAKRFLWSYRDDTPDSKIKGTISDLFPELAKIRNNMGGNPVKEVVIEAGYWRKVNHVHKWFVDKVQEGNDDCGYYYVSREQLSELKSVCMQLLSKKWHELNAIENKSDAESGWQLILPGELAVVNDAKSADQLASELLPRQSGFFFGGTDYDQYYWQGLIDTVKIVDRCLELPNEWEFQYHSSW